jgi:hypothetical protein
LIALGEAFIEAWILLRQNNGFVRDTIAVEVAEIQLTEYSITTLAGKNDPSAVA